MGLADAGFDDSRVEEPERHQRQGGDTGEALATGQQVETRSRAEIGGVGDGLDGMQVVEAERPKQPQDRRQQVREDGQVGVGELVTAYAGVVVDVAAGEEGLGELDKVLDVEGEALVDALESQDKRDCGDQEHRQQSPEAGRGEAAGDHRWRTDS